MKAIRGATTVSEDSPEQIKQAVKELLTEIAQKNGLSDENLVFLLFSNTSDIKSYYPAKAAREAGFYSCALFSAAEPEISGSLKMCIRVMAVVETESQPQHVYLNGAADLRKDISKIINIAIDGPAGSGKSTIAKIIAKRLNMLCLDTGAMYRAAALKCLSLGLTTKDEEAVAKVMENIDLKVELKDGAQRTLLDGADVSDKIRTPQISMAASSFSALGCVRQKMVELQRGIASGISCVLEGRDIGTNVLPDAQFKFFLTASPEVRAQRRFEENRAKGFVEGYYKILKDITERDEQDKNRRIAPLVKAADAIEIDTSDLNIEQVTAIIEKRIQEKI